MTDRSSTPEVPSAPLHWECPNHWHCNPRLAAHSCETPDRMKPCPLCDEPPESGESTPRASNG